MKICIRSAVAQSSICLPEVALSDDSAKEEADVKGL